MRHALLAVVLVLFAVPALAEEPPTVTIERRQGEPVRGQLIEFTKGTFRVLFAGSIIEVREEDVRQVRFEPAAPSYRSRHEAPRITRADTGTPGRVKLEWQSSRQNEYVLTSLELWRRAAGGEWERVAAPDPFPDEPVDTQVMPGVDYEYKLVSVARPDKESPVVQRYGLTLADEAIRRESPAVGPVRVTPRVRVAPIAVLPGEREAIVLVLTHEENAWKRSERRVRVGAEVGPGVVLAGASIAGTDRDARLVLRLTLANGATFEATDQDALELDPRDARGFIAPGKNPGPSDATLREALTSRRPVTLSYQGTPFEEVLRFLSVLLGVDVVASPSIDPESIFLTLQVKDIPRVEALAIIEAQVAVELVPWCGVVWVQPSSGKAPYEPPAASGPAGELLERTRVSFDFRRLPFGHAMDLLRAQTGLNIVLSTDAMDLVENESVTTTASARDVSLRQALTLVVNGTEHLRWHARGSVLHVLGRAERPTREVAAERGLEFLATGRSTRELTGASEESPDRWSDVASSWETYFEGPRTAETIAREARLYLQGGRWWLPSSPPRKKGAPASPTAPISFAISSETYPLHAVWIERGTVTPLTDLTTLASIDADLWVEASASTIGPLTSRTLGVDLGDRRARVAPVVRPLSQLASAPGIIPWTTQPQQFDDNELLVRSNSGGVYVLRVHRTRPQGDVRLTFTPFTLAAPTEAGEKPREVGERPRLVRIDPRQTPVALVSFESGSFGPAPDGESPIVSGDLVVEANGAVQAITWSALRTPGGPRPAGPDSAVALATGTFDAIHGVPAGLTWTDRLAIDVGRSVVFFVRSAKANVHKVELTRTEGALELRSLPLGIDEASAHLLSAYDALKRPGQAYLAAAEAAFHAAIKADPSRIESYHRLAVHQLVQRRPADALSTMERAAQLSPSSPDVYRARAQAHERLGSFDAAIADVERVLALIGPDHPERAELGAWLEQLKKKKQQG